MSPSEVGRLCHSMPALTWLDLTGGEPMLRDDIVEVFTEVLAHAPALAVLHFPTNGWFAERAAACSRLVRERRPDVSLIVTVSIDGSPRLHDRLRGRDGSYDRAIATHRTLGGIEGVDVVVGTTVGPHNRDALDELRHALQRDLPDFRDQDWHWNLCQISRHYFANEDIVRDPTRDEDLVRLHIRRRWPPTSAVQAMEMVFLVNLLAHVQGRPVGLPCQALDTTCFVSADAQLYPCHLVDQPLADLRDWNMDVGDVWRRPEVLAAREQVDRLACGGCFTPCEAYPMVVGSPVRAAVRTAARLFSR